MAMPGLATAKQSAPAARVLPAEATRLTNWIDPEARSPLASNGDHAVMASSLGWMGLHGSRPVSKPALTTTCGWMLSSSTSTALAVAGVPATSAQASAQQHAVRVVARARARDEGCG